MIKSLSNLFRSKIIRLGFGFVIGVLSLYLALRNVSFREVAQVLWSANWLMVGLAILSSAANNLAKTFRWRVLLGEAGQHTRSSYIFGALMVGQMLNIVYPGRIGDLGRAYLLGNYGVGRSFSLGTIVVEKVFDLLSYAVLFLILLLLIPLPSWAQGSGYTVILITLVTTVGIFLITYKQAAITRLAERIITHLPDHFKNYLMPRLRSGIASVGVLQNRGDLLKLAAWSAVIWGLALLTNQFMMMALAIQLPLTAPLLVLVVLQIGISVSYIPAVIGIFEYICVLALTFFKVSQAGALSYGLALHTVVMLPVLLVGMGYSSLLGVDRRQMARENPEGDKKF